MREYTPEQALIVVISELKSRLGEEIYTEIVPAGSVPLGTYVGHPDLDIFIVTDGTSRQVMKMLELYYPKGRRKEGELDIWWLHNYYGYDVDLVILDKSDEKVQTLRHVKYYMEKLDDDMRERIRWLKTFFKDINCYGAEVGGITGICVTRIAEIYETVDWALNDLIVSLMDKDGWFVEDPTLKDRNLFASVTNFKRQIIIQEVHNYLITGKYNVRDLDYFFDNYERVYRIKRKKRAGIDKEFQFIYSCIHKMWKQLKNRVRWWNPYFVYDIYVTPWDIFIGVIVDPALLEGPAVEEISVDRLSKKALENLLKVGAVYSEDKRILLYERQPPFDNLLREVTRDMADRIMTKYITVERA